MGSLPNKQGNKNIGASIGPILKTLFDEGSVFTCTLPLFIVRKDLKMDRKIYYYLDRVEKAERGESINPITCEIDPSNMCQCDCSFCINADYRKKNKEFLDWEVYKQLLQNLIKIGVKSITFTGGGEPLTHPKFSEMADSALIAGFEIGLVTNGIGLHKIKHPEEFKFIRVSLDANDSQTYLQVKKSGEFNKVLFNIKNALLRKATVGLSYVVCKENEHGIEEAQELAKELGVAYIQVKPAWGNGGVYNGYKVKDEKSTIVTKRFIPGNSLSCSIAGLVGVVGATGDVYYCCQQRGKDEYKLGSLYDESFDSIWKRRPRWNPNIKSCPICRYMSYARVYKEFVEGGTMFFKHKNFL